MTDPSSRAWKCVAAVVAVTAVGFLVGTWRADARCTGGDCGILVVEIAFWTAGAFVVGLLAVAVAALVARSRRRRDR